MIDDTNDIDQKNLETLKITSEEKAWVLDEQDRLRKAEGKKPTHAKIFHRMRLAYVEAKGTLAAPELQRSAQTSKTVAGLPLIEPGVKIKGTQLTLYRELVAKVAEVIARGDSNLVAALARGIRWAHGDLRPAHPKPEEPRVEAIPPTSPKKRHGT